MQITRRRFILLFVLTCAIVFIFLPFNLTMAPSRNFTITNTKGTPIPCLIVRQHWDQYSLDVRGQEDFVHFSNNDVKLPKRELRTTVFSLVKGAIKQICELGLHAGFGSFESIGIFAKGYQHRWLHAGRGLDKNIVLLAKGESSQITSKSDKFDEYLIKKCRELKPGIKVGRLTENFWLPEIESYEDGMIWISFGIGNKNRQISAKVNPKDNAVLELRCEEGEASQWVVDRN